MIATGYKYEEIAYLNDVEMIDIQSSSSCANKPTNFPLNISLGIALRYHNKPMICGGRWGPTDDDVSDQCYLYENNTWSLYANLLTPRASATSVQIRPKEWLIIGGTDGYLNLKTSEIFREEDDILMIGPGPPLPEVIVASSGVMLNETHLFLSSNGVENYLLNVDTFEWTELADRLESTSYHSTGLFFNSTIDETQVAVLSNRDIEVYTVSTNTWSIFSRFGSLQFSSAIQPSQKYFWLFGGRDWTSGDFVESASMYRFDENGLTVVEENALQLNRYEHVASYMLEPQIACY